jgi:predicted methyltransferase MtxX (methanogen marker protein 4)
MRFPPVRIDDRGARALRLAPRGIDEGRLRIDDRGARALGLAPRGIDEGRR